MCIGNNQAMLCCYLFKSSDAEVLANLGNLFYQCILNCLRAIKIGCPIGITLAISLCLS